MYELHERINLDAGIKGVIAQVYDDREIPTFEVMIENGNAVGTTVTMIAIADLKLVPLVSYQRLRELPEDGLTIRRADVEVQWLNGLQSGLEA